MDKLAIRIGGALRSSGRGGAAPAPVHDGGKCWGMGEEWI